MASSDPIPPAERSKAIKAGKSAVRKPDIRERDRSSYDGPIVKSEDFRAGIPALPKLPMEVHMPWDQHNSTWSLCASQGATILQRAGFDYDLLSIYMIRGKDRSRFHPTIWIWVPGSDDKPLWQLTLVRIGNMLYEEGALDMHVLITEPRGLQEQRSHAYNLTPDPILLRLWPEEIAPRVIEAIKDEVMGVFKVCMWNWGPTEEAAEPTIVIVVRDKAAYRWDALIDHVSGICAECGAPGLEVDVIEGRKF